MHQVVRFQKLNVKLPICLCREPGTVVAGSPGLLRAARDKLMARERGKEEVRIKIF